jgi:hypothetical protein
MEWTAWTLTQQYVHSVYADGIRADKQTGAHGGIGKV